MKFPKTLYVTKDKESDGNEYLLAWNDVPENDLDRVAQYQLVRVGKIFTQEPKVGWNKRARG